MNISIDGNSVLTLGTVLKFVKEDGSEIEITLGELLAKLASSVLS